VEAGAVIDTKPVLASPADGNDPALMIACRAGQYKSVLSSISLSFITSSTALTGGAINFGSFGSF
jgi:hypothetical protein